jgi:hypothetical protein
MPHSTGLPSLKAGIDRPLQCVDCAPEIHFANKPNLPNRGASKQCPINNWRGLPLISHEVIINLIAATTTTAGLAVKSKLDTNTYPAGLKVSDQQMAELQLRRDKFHGDWNYSLLSRS